MNPRYLRRSGQRSEEQLDEYTSTVLSREWTALYRDPRQMTIYGAVQELSSC